MPGKLASGWIIKAAKPLKQIEYVQEIHDRESKREAKTDNAD